MEIDVLEFSNQAVATSMRNKATSQEKNSIHLMMSLSANLVVWMSELIQHKLLFGSILTDGMHLIFGANPLDWLFFCVLGETSSVRFDFS